MSVLTLVFLGCGGQGVSTIDATGQVLLNGEPLTSGSVVTKPAAGRGATASIGTDGSFTLRTKGIGEGAVPGNHRVGILSYENPEDAIGNPEARLRLAVPQLYTSPETSNLEINVEQGSENNFVLELTSEGR